jgi:hypothetical protein
MYSKLDGSHYYSQMQVSGDVGCRFWMQKLMNFGSITCPIYAFLMTLALYAMFQYAMPHTPTVCFNMLLLYAIQLPAEVSSVSLQMSQYFLSQEPGIFHPFVLLYQS